MIFASKYHAYGNDFLVLGADQADDPADLARAICDPHFGVGADGCVLLEVGISPPYRARIFNCDGSEAEMSGNGIRCAAAWLHHRRLAPGSRVEFLTLAGKRSCELISAQEPRWLYRSEMGEPAFEAEKIPFADAPPGTRVCGWTLKVAGWMVPVTLVSMGNPQCVVFVDELPGDEEFRLLGSGLSTHPAFPAGTNVSFVRVDGPRAISIRIWERGVGPTFSSGTGCCGAAVAALNEQRVESPVEVRTPTGTQQVEWVPGQPVYLTGEACFIADVHWVGLGKQ
jgi:diaminopimelate epimerase